MILPRHAPIVRQRAHQQVPRVEARGRLAMAAEILRRMDLRLDCRGDRVGDLVLHGEDVDELAVVAFGPEMAAGGGVVELRGDAHAVVGLADAALDDVADPELLGDLPDMDRAPLVGEGRVAGDHHEPALLRQCGEYVFADPVAEIFLRGIAAHVLEGEHCDSRAVRRDARRGRRGFGWRKHACRFFPDVADETKALARDGLDQPLSRAVVAERLARGVDPAVQR